MSRFLPVALSALALFAPQAHCSLDEYDVGAMTRALATVPTGYAQVGQTLVGVVDSAGTTTGSSDVDFGTVVAISDTGTRIAIGAPKHDWSTALDNTGTNVEDAGAVFIFDLDGGSWTFKTFFVGTAAEEIGKWLSMSADGSVIALRRGGNPRPTEVWEVDSAGNKVQRGSNITCADQGAQVSLSPDGTRIAVSCEFFGGSNTGEVRLFDWNTGTTAWDPIGTLTIDALGTTAGLFGWDTAFALNGARIAISAPNYEDTATFQGLVQVYDYDGTTWSQLGNDLYGVQQGEKFGFTMGISSDGETVVVGSPNKDLTSGDNSASGTAKGEVAVYELSGGNTWTPVTAFSGEANSDDRLGRGIAVKDDGTRFVVASSSHNAERGQVLVFDLINNVWTNTAEIEGSDPGDHLGFNNMGVAMTADGTSLVAGSIDAQVDGTVQVFAAPLPTPEPSQAPSLAPSASPAPSGPIIPNPGQFDWVVERTGSAELEFSNEAETSEIVLNYNISLRDTLVRLFREDCVTPVPDTVANYTTELTYVTETYGDFEVAIDIKQDAVLSSPIWVNTSATEGYFSLCVRVDLLLDDVSETSVSFHEQKLFVSVGLAQGFSVVGVALDRLAASEESGDVDLNFDLTAFLCDESANPTNETLTQGSDCYICVETTAPNVEIAQIQSLVFAQNEFNITAISNSTPNALTFVAINGKEAQIRHQLVSQFFADEDPDDVTATGVCLLTFTDDNGRRHLRSVDLFPDANVPRELEEEDEPFSVVMSLASDGGDASSAAAKGVLSVVVVGLVGALATM